MYGEIIEPESVTVIVKETNPKQLSASTTKDKESINAQGGLPAGITLK